MEGLRRPLVVLAADALRLSGPGIFHFLKETLFYPKRFSLSLGRNSGLGTSSLDPQLAVSLFSSLLPRTLGPNLTQENEGYSLRSGRRGSSP